MFLYRAGFVLCTGATLAVVAAVARPTWIGRGLGVRPLVWVGQRSYSLYLWHWPIFVLTRPVLDLQWEWWRIFLLRMVLTVAISAASYRLIETPARNGAVGRWWRSLRARSAGAGRVRRQTFALCTVMALVLVPSTVALARAEPKVDQIEASIESGQDALQDQVLPATTVVGSTAASATATTTSTTTTTTRPSPTATSRPGVTSAAACRDPGNGWEEEARGDDPTGGRAEASGHDETAHRGRTGDHDRRLGDAGSGGGPEGAARDRRPTSTPR